MNMTENVLSVCGVCCRTDCSAFGVECAGCRELKGKVSWAKFIGKSECPIFKCVNDKRIKNCGHCELIPCDIWLLETRNPQLTDLEYAADLKSRRRNLFEQGEMMANFNGKIRAELEELLAAGSYILAAWEGGSKATGYFDEYSDLDLQIIVEDDKVEEVFREVEKYLEGSYGIKHKFRIPEPNWHGHSQCFYLLDNSPEYFYVDFLVEKETAGNRFLESDRHGNAAVWFDKKNLIDTTATPEDEIKRKCRSFFERVNVYIPFCFLDVQKQILRNNQIDAFAIYFSLLNRFIALLNIKYRPAKHDFGMRYLHRDFPEKEQNLVKDLMYVPDIKKLQENLHKIQKMYPELVKGLEAILKS